MTMLSPVMGSMKEAGSKGTDEDELLDSELVDSGLVDSELDARGAADCDGWLGPEDVLPQPKKYKGRLATRIIRVKRFTYCRAHNLEDIIPSEKKH